MWKWILLSGLLLLIGGCKGDHPQYNGYIDADLTYLSSNSAGRLDALLVHRGQRVEKNQLLFKLEQTSENYQVSLSQYNQDNLLSQRKEILDQMQYNALNYQRTKQMRRDEVASQNDLEVAKKDLNVLKNKLAAIDFQIKGNQVNTEDKSWQLTRKVGHASEAGLIYDTYFNQDEYVQAGQPVLSLITPTNIKVVFFVPEQALSKLRLNAKVTVSTDGQANMVTGEINYISNIAQYTPPIIYSREDRHSLVFRVEARLNIPHLDQIHLGQPVSLELV
jgi:HlyD family secretion protein